MDKGSQVTGGCICGRVRFEARAFLKDAYYCHCRMCQKTSGAPAEVAVTVESGTLKFTRGQPKFYQSSPFGERGFCADCGSRLMWRHVGGKHPEFTNLSVGSLDQPGEATPTSHQCVESQLPWYRVNDDLPRLRSDEIPELVDAWRAAEKGKIDSVKE